MAAHRAVLIGGACDGQELSIDDVRPNLRIAPHSPVSDRFREPGARRVDPEIYVLEYDGAQPARDRSGRLRYLVD